jgi:DNA polymerase phi
VKTPAVASDGRFWVAKVLETIEHLEKDSKHVSLLAQIDEEDQLLCTKAREVCKNLRMVRLIASI